MRKLTAADNFEEEKKGYEEYLSKNYNNVAKAVRTVLGNDVIVPKMNETSIQIESMGIELDSNDFKVSNNFLSGKYHVGYSLETFSEANVYYFEVIYTFDFTFKGTDFGLRKILDYNYSDLNYCAVFGFDEKGKLVDTNFQFV